MGGWDDLWDDEPPPTLADVDAMVENGEDEFDPNAPVEGQITAFGDDDSFKIAWGEWGGMPSFVQENLQPKHSVTVNFMNLDDLKRFEELVGQKIVITSSRGIWFPPIPVASYADKRFRSTIPESGDA